MKFNNLLLFSLIALIGNSCERPPMHGAKHLTFLTHENINHKLALRVHIIQIFSKDLLTKIKNMSSEEFLDQKTQLIFDNPEEMKVWEIDLLEKSEAECYVLPHSKSYWGAVIFIEFLENGKNKLVYPPNQKHMILQIENGKFKIIPENHHHENHHHDNKFCKELKLLNSEGA